MHLSPIKGGFPHKDQHDRTAPVALDNKANEGIERGSVIRINDKGEFELADNASVFPMFLALQPVTDLQAQMAGFFGAGRGPTLAEADDGLNVVNKFGEAPAASTKGPAISGIHMDDGDVWETDEFDENADWSKANFNDPLTVKAGRITCDGATEENCVGFLVKKPYQRYANDAWPKDMPKGIMTGAKIRVIQFQCGK